MRTPLGLTAIMLASAAQATPLETSGRYAVITNTPVLESGPVAASLGGSMDTVEIAGGGGVQIRRMETGISRKDLDGQVWPTRLAPMLTGAGGIRFPDAPLTVELAPRADSHAVVTTRRSDREITARSAVAAIAFYQPENNQFIILAEPVEATPEPLLNGAVYYDAFEGVNADVVYSVHPWGLEQDVVVYGGLPHPKTLGLNPETTILCVLTELLDADGRIDRQGMSDTSETANFRPIHVYKEVNGSEARIHDFQRGIAYEHDSAITIGGGYVGENSVNVRHRLVDLEGRRFLVEELDFAEAASRAPEVIAQEILPPQTRGVPRVRAVRDTDMAEAEVPETNGQTLLAYQPRGTAFLVIDYLDYAGAVSNDVVFRAGDTHYVSGDLIINDATLTVMPGAVVKFATNAAIKLINNARIVTKSHSLNPALFTSAYDTNSGQNIPGYAGGVVHPFKAGLIVENLAQQIEGIRFQHALRGIQFTATAAGDQWIEHCQFHRVERGIEAVDMTNRWIDVKNTLFTGGVQAVWMRKTNLRMGNVTLDNLTGVGVVITGAPSYAVINDSLFASLTNTVFAYSGGATPTLTHNARYNAPLGSLGANVLVLTNSPFRTGPHGTYYLDQSSPLINAGSQAAHLEPELYHFTTATNHLKETNSVVDIGFHYGTPIDTDGDGLYDYVEDGNGDGLYEPDAYDPSDWLNADTDGDGLNDHDEFLLHHTDPQNADTDGDGFTDGQEVAAGADPLNASSYLTTISGNITYDGRQPGLIHVTARSDTGLVLHLNFDHDSGATVADVSGHANHAGVHGGAAWTADGYRGGGYYFNGSNGYLRITRHTSFDTPRFTISAWVKLDGTNVTVPARGLFGRHRAGYNTHSWWAFADSAGLRGQLWGASASALLTTNLGPVTRQWGFVAMTYDGETLSWYLNGDLVAASSVGGYAGNTLDLLVGAGEYTYGSGVPDRFWQGWIDEVRMYDRALSQAELVNVRDLGTANTNVYRAIIQHPGAYTITAVPNQRRYDLEAWRDQNANDLPDAMEAAGIYTGNLVHVIAAVTGADIALVDLDTDGDGMPDWWEIEHGLNPTSGLHASLAGWWKFDEMAGTNAFNAASTSYHGVLNNLTSNAWVGGRIGGALQFGGTNGVVRIPQPTAMITGGPFTVSGLVYYDASAPDDFPTVISDLGEGCGSGYSGFWMGYDKYAPGAEGYLGSCSAGDTWIAGGSSITGRWVQMTMSYDGANMRVYIDGIQVAASSANMSTSSRTNLLIGWADHPDFGSRWKGKLDDIRLYTSALSSNHIAALYDVFDDPDEDGLTNLEEYLLGTDPNQDDTDGDGLTDYDEVHLYGTDPTNPDTDSDGLSDGEEINLHGTDPNNWDTDGDLLMDGREVNYYMTDPAKWDTTEWIGLSDAVQKLTGDQWPGLALQITNMWGCGGCMCLVAAPTEASEYYDFYGYYYDYANNYNLVYRLLDPSIPGGSGSTAWSDCGLTTPFYAVGFAHDIDGDGISDSYEVLILGTSPDKIDSSMPPNGISDADEDFDADGLTNLQEYYLKTNPWNPDTDGDGLNDGEEVALGTDPLTPNEPAAITIYFPRFGNNHP
ncbi:MAG TPA: hypothetical protein PKE26_11520 [Kiritimatiellia bacterium]|nr:hypothetical protein [Kiritimatiellia bacterium]